MRGSHPLLILAGGYLRGPLSLAISEQTIYIIKKNQFISPSTIPAHSIRQPNYFLIQFPSSNPIVRGSIQEMSHCHDEHDHHGHGHDHGEHDHSDDITPALQSSLYEQINFDEITTLNEARRDAGKAIVKKTWAERLSAEPELASDADEQLLMTVPWVFSLFFISSCSLILFTFLRYLFV